MQKIKCYICGRKLSNPKSIALGAGAVCYEKIRKQPKQRARLKKYVLQTQKQLEIRF
jgi:hypothetical protein